MIQPLSLKVLSLGQHSPASETRTKQSKKRISRRGRIVSPIVSYLTSIKSPCVLKCCGPQLQNIKTALKRKLLRLLLSQLPQSVIGEKLSRTILIFDADLFSQLYLDDNMQQVHCIAPDVPFSSVLAD